jgi:hypothetical protein
MKVVRRDKSGKKITELIPVRKVISSPRKLPDDYNSDEESDHDDEEDSEEEDENTPDKDVEEEWVEGDDDNNDDNDDNNDDQNNKKDRNSNGNGNGDDEHDDSNNNKKNGNGGDDGDDRKKNNDKRDAHVDLYQPGENKKLVPCTRFVEDFQPKSFNERCNRCLMIVSQHPHRKWCMYTQDQFFSSHPDIDRCSACHMTIAQHPIRPLSSDSSSSSDKISKINYPLYPQFKEGDDPYLFMSKFNDAIRLDHLDSSRWIPMLKHCIQDVVIKQWVETDLVSKNMKWEGKDGIRMKFIRHVLPPDYETKLRAKLGSLRNNSINDLHHFFSEFLDLCFKLDYDITTKKTINDCEYRLCEEVKELLSQYRTNQLTLTGRHDFEFSSVVDLRNVALFATKNKTSKSKNSKRKGKKGRENEKSKSSPNFDDSGETNSNDKNNSSYKKKRRGRWNKKNKNKNTNADGHTAMDGGSVSKVTAAPNPSFDMKKQPVSDFSKKPGNQNDGSKPDNRTCYNCGEKGHIRRNCSKPVNEQAKQKGKNNKVPKVNYIASEVAFDRNLQFDLVADQNQKVIVVKLANCNELLLPLPDSGAELSIIKEELVRKMRFHVFEPTGKKFIKLADKRLVRRNGYVIIPLTIMFPHTNKKPIVMKKQFEVFDIESPMIFGVDILPHLFPYDEFTHYMIPPSSITSAPVVDNNMILCYDDEEDICLNDESCSWESDQVNTTQTYSLMDENDNEKSKEKKMSFKEKFELERLKTLDNVVTDVGKDVEDEFEKMRKEMEKLVDNEDQKDDIDVDELKDKLYAKALEGVSEYFQEHHIRFDGPFRSSFQKRLQRHLQ